MANPSAIRIGYVPEHYLLPLHLARPHMEKAGLETKLIPFPSGTGHMITSLRSNEIDLAIGLTEGWVAGLLNEAGRKAKDYNIVGSWCENPLRWAIVTGRNRKDISSVADLAKHRRVGVSRMGSGSHIMATVLAQQEKWLDPKEPGAAKEALEFIPLGPFKDLRDGVTGHGKAEDATADFFMWEHFTTKPYFHGDDTLLKWIGEIYTPWPSWHIAASTRTFPDPDRDKTLNRLFEVFDQGMQEFRTNPDRAIKMLGDGSANCHYSEEDAREWLKSARFFSNTRGVSREVMQGVVDVLKVAGAIGEDVTLDENGNGNGVLAISRA